jgi:DNA (cytosine-5)-methyltransferase 1
MAWHDLGFQPVWFSQFDPEHNYKRGPDFASKVLAERFPEVPNLGDMTKLKENEIYRNSKFQLLVGGTPCQDFSIAGLRSGLAGERSNIALDFIEILRDKQPKYFVWENVPGVLTSGKDGDTKIPGLDFACLLSGFTGQRIAPQRFTAAGSIEAATDTAYSISWRVLDSKYFGVPQRRRRVFVVGHLGKNWRPSAAILFERESLCRDFTPGKETGKGIAKDTAGRAKRSNSRRSRGVDWPSETASCLDTTFGNNQGLENQHIDGGLPLCTNRTVGMRMLAFGEYADDETASTMKKRDYKDFTDLVIHK